MYAESIVARRISSYERSTGTALCYSDIGKARELVDYLEGRPDPSDRKGRRRLRPRITPELRRFTDNELAMSKASFLYWARRYAFIQQSTGGGGFGLFVPWESQWILLQKIASAEEYMYLRRAAGDPSYDGICYFIHKARQLGFTVLCQLLLLHRAVFYADTRTFTVSLDQIKTGDVHKRWSDTYEKLPWWMQTPVERSDVELGKWLRNGSKVSLQHFSQESGLGQGEQWDAGHLTEVASVPDNYCRVALANHFLPTITNSLRAMAFMESTAQGYGNWWHRSTELARRGGFNRWRYCFVPWYAEKTKNARYDIPVGWSPSTSTLNHAAKIERTSWEWLGNGDRNYVYTPTRPQLYFYETARKTAEEQGELAEFLTNFCADPEESFQLSSAGAFNPEIIQLLDDAINTKPSAYILTGPGIPGGNLRNYSKRDPSRSSPTVGAYTLVPVVMDEADRADPRGLWLEYERPDLRLWYSTGADSADGIAGWHPTTRTQLRSELDKDNACVTSWYRDPNGRSRQAFEYAGPVTPSVFAAHCFVACHRYSGAYNDIGSPLILEVYPAVGGASTQKILQYQFAFSHFYRWVIFDGQIAKPTNHWGWYSSTKSVRDLWVQIKELVENKETTPVRPQSRYLTSEMRGCVWDPVRARGHAMDGLHDDRVSGSMFALWQLNDLASPIPKQRPDTTKADRPQFPCIAACAYTTDVSGHDYWCKNFPIDRVDFSERDITTFEQLSQLEEEWIARVTGSPY